MLERPGLENDDERERFKPDRMAGSRVTSISWSGGVPPGPPGEIPQVDPPGGSPQDGPNGGTPPDQEMLVTRLPAIRFCLNHDGFEYLFKPDLSSMVSGR